MAKEALPQGASSGASPNPIVEEITGLTKTEAEEVLDWLEANGYPPAVLSHEHGGFSVRFSRQK